MSWHCGALPVIRPVNHLVGGDSVVIRTHTGSPLVHNTFVDEVVVFEADQFDAHTRTGWSVMVTGRAAPVTAPLEVARYRTTPHPLGRPGHEPGGPDLRRDCHRVPPRTLTVPPRSEQYRTDRGPRHQPAQRRPGGPRGRRRHRGRGPGAVPAPGPPLIAEVRGDDHHLRAPTQRRQTSPGHERSRPMPYPFFGYRSGRVVRPGRCSRSLTRAHAMVPAKPPPTPSAASARLSYVVGGRDHNGEEGTQLVIRFAGVGVAQ